LEIHLFGARMFMIMEVNEHFSFEANGRADHSDPKVQEWENLMWRFQQSLPQGETRGEKAADGKNRSPRWIVRP
jgi:L-rhamnose mutarotase